MPDIFKDYPKMEPRMPWKPGPEKKPEPELVPA
jgi:hypothetical protein